MDNKICDTCGKEANSSGVNIVKAMRSGNFKHTFFSCEIPECRKNFDLKILSEDETDSESIS